MRAEAAIATGTDSREVIASLIDQLPMLRDGASSVDLALVFASDAFAPELADVLTDLRRLTGARVLIGCSGQGIIGPEREVEDQPAIALQTFSLPGADLQPFHLLQEDASAGELLSRLQDQAPGFDPEKTRAVMVFADPFTMDCDQLLASFAALDDRLPLFGGLASGDFRRRATYLFLNDAVFEEGAVGLLLAGPYTVRTIVSQGAAPIGETWTITAVEGNLIETIGMRPALDVLSETFQSLPAETQERVRRNLLVGLAMNEYKDEFRRGDFLIRNLMGIDHESGAIAIGAMPRVGQTIQFQVRDPEAADEDLRQLLEQARREMEGEEVIGTLLCSCNGRGQGLFGAPDHDARALRELLGPLPVAGFFCNGEIGPVGGRNFLHGFTASIALIVPAVD